MPWADFKSQLRGGGSSGLFQGRTKGKNKKAERQRPNAGDADSGTHLSDVGSLVICETSRAEAIRQVRRDKPPNVSRAFSILVESTWTILHLSPSGRGRREAPGEGFDQSIGCNPSPQPSPNGRGSTRRLVAGVSTKIEKALASDSLIERPRSLDWSSNRTRPMSR